MCDLDGPMRYDRAIRKDFLALLRSGGALNSLTTPGAIGGLPLDAQLRRNEFAIYAGLTKVASFTLRRGRRLNVNAAPEYRDQMQSFFGVHGAADLDKVAERWEQFRSKVAIKKNYLDREGALQSMLVERYGRNYIPGDPWCFIDREAVLQHTTKRVGKAAFERSIRGAFEDVLHAIKEDRTVTIGKNAEKAFGDELDLLGVTAERDLVVCEVKDGGNVSGLYMAPVQVAAYHQRWTRVPDAKQIASDVNAPIDQKVAIGLLPETAPRLRPGFAVDAVVITSEPRAGSRAWSIYATVCRHLAQHHPAITGRLSTFVADPINGQLRRTSPAG